MFSHRVGDPSVHLAAHPLSIAFQRGGELEKRTSKVRLNSVQTAKQTAL